MLLKPCPDFEFSICSSINFEQQYSSADELFANGMILPKVVKKCEAPSVASLPPRPKSSSSSVEVRIKDMEEKTQPKSFWGFKRSSSLNCDKKKSLICSIPLLSRSNSTGSFANPKRSSSIKDGNKHGNSMAYQFPQKPPLKKNNGNYAYGNGVRISPVLNVPPPYISKGTVNLFGLGSLLRNGKAKKSRK
ncbi:Zinc finger protein-related isoform 1 [Hibiscus syriacus]|uniref:Zinc finger protein-related isoform 1 n=2 Tax=Hibiscus syriacus TaxID=106335 RepID=A0A6A3B324_HIBSY|nr:Zinc finger protein-related isoform 1 [Hibiscus syriacus]